MQHTDLSIFDLAPIPMWLEDYSQLKEQFDQWRDAQVSDLAAFLKEDVARAQYCASLIKVIRVNQKALDLFEASTQEQLVSHLSDIFKKDMFHSFINELVELWEGKTEFSAETVNYTLGGAPIDVQLRAVVLPGFESTLGRLLVTTENITPYQNARRQEKIHRLRAEGYFNHSPVSLWIEDFSRIKKHLDHLRDIGIHDFQTFLDVHPEFIKQCIDNIIILDVNQATLNLFQAESKNILFTNIAKVFSDEVMITFREQLIELWNGNIHHQRESVNYALDGSIRNVLLQFSVFPGYEDSWSLVQVALTDITARKKAENYLEYLGKHDVLTKLYNRSFFNEELNRLERSTLRPVSCIFLDMDSLKEVNDLYGHDAGDSLLRRVGEVLQQAITRTPYTASRIGGDEFVVLMPGAEENAVDILIETINNLLEIDNQYYSSQQLSISLGFASSQPNESMQSLIRRADQDMYRSKNKSLQKQPSQINLDAP